MRLMADATTAARDRVDRALAALERKVMELKARPASAPSITDDDLFASVPADQARIAELEAAGREASAALARAADQLRGLLSTEQEADD
jgi:Zn-dependent protease with chaperone function